jgi:hypothetical protein
MRRSLAVGAVIIAFSVSGQAFAGLIAVDEWGNGVGTVGPGFLGPDPTGGLPNWYVLIYNLPFAGVPGDVMMDADEPAEWWHDIVRFTGQGQIIFYSSGIDGYDASADTPGGPGNVWPPEGANLAWVTEMGPEGNNFALYAPLPTQPGWDPTVPSYRFVSDGQVPEPATLTLVALGGVGMMVRRRRK